jgi:hypothetical protein
MADDRGREILRRLSVEEPDGLDERSAERLVGRLVDEAATRELRSLEARARASNDAAIGRDVASLHHGLVRLRDANWQLSEVDDLVAWLAGASPT